MIHILATILLYIFTASLVNIPSATLTAVSFIMGQNLAGLVCTKNDRRGRTIDSRAIRIYATLFEFGWCYMLLCYCYMTAHGYEWLLTWDSFDQFIPRTENYISLGQGNLSAIYRQIFKDYNFFYREEYFFWAYSCTWGVIINHIGASFYYGLQNSTLFLYAFCGVVLYKLLQNYGFTIEKSFRRAIQICLFSIIFFYSSQIMRDVHILLCYLIAFYLSSKPVFSIKIVCQLLIVIFITCGLRIESGLFIANTLPLFMMLSIQRPETRRFQMIIAAIFLAFSTAYFIIPNYFAFRNVYSENRMHYIDGTDEGNGLTATFHRIPFIGNILSILFNASNPIPVWNRLIAERNAEFGGAVNNIMNIVRIPAVIFNILTYVYILLWLVHYKLRRRLNLYICPPLKYQMLLGFIFLFLQSAVISQRRLMGYYCIFYVFMFLIYDNLKKEERIHANAIVAIVFILLQIVGIMYLS